MPGVTGHNGFPVSGEDDAATAFDEILREEQRKKVLEEVTALQAEKPKSTRAEAREEIRKLNSAQRHSQSRAQVALLRVGVWMRIIDESWVSVSMRVRLGADREWLRLTPKDSPWLVARQFDHGSEENAEKYGKMALSRLLNSNGVVLSSLSGGEYRAGDGVNRWDYWARFTSGRSVAVESQPDGTVRLLGLF